MEGENLWKVAVGLLLTTFVAIVLPSVWLRKRNLMPPSPRRLPLVGNLFSVLGDNPHISFAKLAWKHNLPILTLQLGAKTVFLVSSPAVAKEMLVTSGSDFASRGEPNFISKILVGAKNGNGVKGVLYARYDRTWQMVRRVMATGFRRACGLSKLLDEDIEEFFQGLERESQREGNEVVEVSRHLWTLLSNNQLRYLFGPGFTPERSQAMIHENTLMMGCVARGKLSELVPVLEPFLSKMWSAPMRALQTRKYQLLDDLLADRHKYGKEGDWYFCDTVMEAVDNGEIDRENGMHVLDELIIGGTETQAVTLEWGFYRIAYHPHIQLKLREEIDSVVGKGRLVQVQDVERLPYLRGFVKELLRLHMPIPILVAHQNEHPAKLAGYNFPAHSSFLVNQWALAHDEKIWENAWEFRPERFLEKDKDVLGHDCTFLVFGTGRRMCPGSGLALQTLHAVLANTLLKYELKPPPGSVIDLTESYNSTARMKTNPLHLIFKKRT